MVRITEAPKKTMGVSLGKHRLTEGYRPTPYFRMVIVDNVSLPLNVAGNTLYPSLTLTMDDIAQDLEDNIKRFYHFRQKMGPKNTYMTSIAKGHSVLLVDSLNLFNAVYTFKAKARRTAGGRGKSIVIDISEKFPPYTWIHEYGAKGVVGRSRYFGGGGFFKHPLPRRGFIREALEETGEVVAKHFAGQIGRIKLLLKEPSTFGIQPQILSSGKLGTARSMVSGLPAGAPEVGILQTRIMGRGWLAVLLPPTALWAYVGMASDVYSLLRMQMTGKFMMMFLMAWGKGSMGITQKVWRRKARRKLWSGVM